MPDWTIASTHPSRALHVHERAADLLQIERSRCAGAAIPTRRHTDSPATGIAARTRHGPPDAAIGEIDEDVPADDDRRRRIARDLVLGQRLTMSYDTRRCSSGTTRPTRCRCATKYFSRSAGGRLRNDRCRIVALPARAIAAGLASLGDTRSARDRTSPLRRAASRWSAAPRPMAHGAAPDPHRPAAIRGDQRRHEAVHDRAQLIDLAPEVGLLHRERVHDLQPVVGLAASTSARSSSP